MVPEYDPQDIEAQQSAEASRRTARRLDQESEESDLKWLMGSRRGRRIVWRLLGQAGVFRSSFALNAAQMAFNEGNRNFGQHTLSLIHTHCPELYPLMVKEQSDGRSAESTSRNDN
jgi:hypothetical protein